MFKTTGVKVIVMAFEKPKHGTSLYEWCKGISDGKFDVPDRVKKRMGTDKVYKDAKDFAKKLLQSYIDGGNIKSVKEISWRNGAKVWWEQKCRDDQKPHRWEATVKNRSDGNGCGVCCGFTVQLGVNDLATVNPELAVEWDYEANAEAHEKDSKHPRTPEEVTAGSHKKVFWLSCNATTNCEGHKWPAAVYSRSKGTGCGVCAGQTIQEGENDLATERPDLAKEWDYKANAEAHAADSEHPLTPQEVTAGSDKKVFWLSCNATTNCEGHKWEARVSHRSKGIGCSVCAGQTIQEGENDLTTKRPDLAKEWDYEANEAANKENSRHPRTPQEVTAGSKRKVWWKRECLEGQEAHRWEATVANRSSKGRGCGVCAGWTVQKGFNDLASKKPELVDEWDKDANEAAHGKDSKHPRTPEEVTYSSNKKVYWQCSNSSCGNKWKATVDNRSNGKGCPSCAKSGFKDNKPAWVYVVESDPGGQLPEPCIKFGISNVGSVAGRLGRHSARFKSLEGVGIFGPGKAIREIESLLKKDKGKLVKNLGYQLWKDKHNKTFDGSSETLIDKRVAENSNASLHDLLEEFLEQEEVKKILAGSEVQAFREDYGLKIEVVDLTPETIKEYRDKHQAVEAEAEAEQDSDLGLAEAA